MQRKGYLSSLGADVSVPLTESAPYDLIIDFNEKLHRVQVKYTSGNEVDLRNIHSNAKGYVVKKTLSKTYDWLYVLHKNGNEFLLPNCLINRRSVTFYDDSFSLKKILESIN